MHTCVKVDLACNLRSDRYKIVMQEYNRNVSAGIVWKQHQTDSSARLAVKSLKDRVSGVSK